MLYEEGIYDDLSNEEYHAQQPPEEHYYSSSQLKTMLEDPEKFYAQYIARQGEKSAPSPAMNIGTAWHSEMLEPHRAHEDYVVWEGGKRGTKLYKAFAEEHEGKIILTKPDKILLDRLVLATKNSPVAMNIIEETVAEQSFFLTLFGLRMKIRTDCLHLGEEYSYISDLKSTTGNVKNKHAIRQKVSNSNYDLSAAMYIIVINEAIRKFDLPYAPVTDFFWNFASKDAGGNCKTWRATADQIKVGTAKFMTAVREIQKYTEKEWCFEDCIDDLEPLPWDKTEWIKEETQTSTDDECDLTDML